ncbi:hypothetical protein [Streptomyces decoyicus]|uniref:hypothetical protein n=1 Tax=Streptomyces decoyicus TaxID=249567 RepID=UPI00339E0E5D
MHELRCDPTIATVWDSLPAAASEQLTKAIADVCADPIGTTEPYGIDDGTMRQLVLDDTIVVLLVTETLKLVRILQINHLG